MPRSKQSEQSKQLSTAAEDHGDSELAGAPKGPSNSESQLPTICLKQVFPKYAKQFNYLRLVDRVANLFIRFLGIKGTMKLGPTGFRTFIRSVSPVPTLVISVGLAALPQESLLWHWTQHRIVLCGG